MWKGNGERTDNGERKDLHNGAGIIGCPMQKMKFNRSYLIKFNKICIKIFV